MNDARLADAAPDLLEALERLLTRTEGGSDDAACHDGLTSRENCAQCQRVDAARAAIASAKALNR